MVVDGNEPSESPRSGLLPEPSEYDDIAEIESVAFEVEACKILRR